MRSVPVIIILLALSPFASALDCPKVPVYNATIANICAKIEDTGAYWPDYKNANQYFACVGVGNPLLQTCLPNYLFSFVNQACTLCDRYIPAQPCQAIKGKTCTPFKPAVTPPTKVTTTIAPACNTPPIYSWSFVPTCLGNDDRSFWPNYKNASEFYRCQGEYNPLIVACEKGLLFNFYAQRCTNCASYIAAPVCSKLPFDKSNKCQKL